MGRRPCCSKDPTLNRGAWTAMEDKILRDYIKIHGEGKWRHLPKRAGLKRCGKSCRLRWLNYLRPDIKRGNITRDEEDLIIRLHKLLGNRWSLIAGRLPGRTDNEIKNYWNTNIGKKVQSRPIYSTSKQSKEKSRSKVKLPSGQPPSPTRASCVVRTKASRCTKVFITTEPQSTKQLDIKTVFGPPINGERVNNRPVGEESPFSSGEDNPYHDFMMDFEMDEKFLSEFLNTEFAPLCDSDGCLRGDSSPDFSDLGSMISLLDPKIDWLQD